MAGKGDTTRPPSVPRETFDANWERTFGKPCTTQETDAHYDNGKEANRETGKGTPPNTT